MIVIVLDTRSIRVFDCAMGKSLVLEIVNEVCGSQESGL